MNREKALIHSLLQHPGWLVLKEKWEIRYKEENSKLRHYKRDDAFYRCQGALNFYDKLMLDVDTTLDDEDETGE